MRYDLHTHSKYSKDGWMEPETLVKTAVKKGLAGIAVTDHNTLEGGLKAKEFETENFEVVVGSEIATDRGEVIGLFLSEEIVSRNFIEVINEIKNQSGTVVLPHPFDELRGNGIAPGKKDAKLVDCIETFNSRCFRTIYNEMAAEYAKKYGLKSLGGSDAHFAHEVGGAGVATDEDLHDAFERGSFTVFGERSSIMNLGLTKVLKIWRKTGSGSY
jgi:predicted metal-dependent phosphoesterase TrpH